MIKIQMNFKSIFILILAQTFLAMLLGLLALFFITYNHVSPKAYVGGVSIGGLSREEASQRLEEYYGNIINDAALVIKYGKDKTFEIKYSDIDASFNSGATIDLLCGANGFNSVAGLLKGYFNFDRNEAYPIISMNDGKLRDRLEELAEIINKNAVEANIRLKDGKVEKEAEADGLKLNIENAIQKIKREAGIKLSSDIIFDLSHNYELQAVKPHYTVKGYFEGADEVISQYSTGIKANADENSIRLAAAAINKVLLRPEDQEGGLRAGEFSFNKYLSQENGITDKNNEGYNQVASTLYAAVLLAGIQQDTVSRTPHHTAVDYIDPGLDARVQGNDIDFKFKNTFKDVLVIFAAVSDNKITVSLVSKKKDPNAEVSLETEVIQKFKPPIISMENQSLKPGEKKLISPGKEGAKVNVYKVVSQNGTEDRKFLYYDKYDAVKAIVEIGPNTVWDEESLK